MFVFIGDSFFVEPILKGNGIVDNLITKYERGFYVCTNALSKVMNSFLLLTLSYGEK